MPLALSHCLPEIICVEKSREFGIDVYHMDIPFSLVTNHGFVVIPRIIRVNVDTKRAVDLEFESRKPSASALTLYCLGITHIVGSSCSLRAFALSLPSTP